jgi:ketosteroid isomerase-like protein
MSRENVEIVRRSWKAFEDDGLDAMAEFWHPDIDWRAVEGALDDVGVFTGRAKKRAYYEDWLAMFDEFRGEVEEVIFERNDLVGVVIHTSGRPRGSAAWAEGRHSVVYTVRHGQIVSGREYASPADAIQATSRGAAGG